MLHLRVLSAVVLGVPVLAAVWFGRPWFDLLIMAGGGTLAWEWGHMLGVRFVPGGLLTVTGVAGAVAVGVLDGALAHGLLVVAAATLVVFAGARLAAGDRPVWQAAGMAYIGVPVVALVWLRGDPGDGRLLVFWLFLVVWATDVGAYAAGRGIGGPRLAPRLSPKKTWAGLGGGAAAAAAVGSGVFAAFPAAHVAPATGALGGALLALAAQGGDLLESVIKRHLKRKDSSHLIPGHGGLFDRVDGVLTAAPVAALAWGVMATGGA